MNPLKHFLKGYNNSIIKARRMREPSQLTLQARSLLAMTDKELAPDIDTKYFPPTEAQIKNKEKRAEYSKGVREGTIKPLTIKEAIRKQKALPPQKKTYDAQLNLIKDNKPRKKKGFFDTIFGR